MTLKMNHLHLKTKDPEKTAQFYVDTFGATVVSRNPKGGVRINLLDQEGLVDLEAVMPHAPSVIAYPKAERAVDMAALSEHITRLERHPLDYSGRQLPRPKPL